MKLKMGAIVTEMRGKSGGHVASVNRGGAYLKSKSTPINRNTSSQVLVRNRITQFSKAWAGLTAAQRAAWNAAVSQWQTTDIFGDLRKPSGLNLYVRLNCNLASIGATAITSPPVPTAVSALTSGSLAVVGGTGVVTLTFAPTVPAGVAMKVKATAPQSAGKTFVKNQFRFIKSIAAAQTSPQVLTTEYAAVHGTPSQVGMVVWMEISYFNITTGQEGPRLLMSATIS